MRFSRFRPALVAGLLAASPAAVAAQEEVRVTVTDRGRIGILIDSARDADSVGARIAEVVEGGPAEGAGLRAGDVITHWNGTALTSGEGRDPGHRLLRMARRLAPGDTVKLDYRRGNETRTASVVADDMPQHVMALPDMERMGRHFDRMGREFGRMGHRLGREFDLHIHRRHGGLELVELNRDLGEYFGTNEGLLVVRAPADSAVPLKAGDVIVTINGRTPQSAGHAHRILGSYEGGEKARVEVLRKRKRTTLEWSVPDHDRWHDRPTRQRPGRRAASGWS
ncbi:MAG: PDZ domain-containing protein [Gemmatimonadales bacterium]